MTMSILERAEWLQKMNDALILLLMDVNNVVEKTRSAAQAQWARHYKGIVFDEKATEKEKDAYFKFMEDTHNQEVLLDILMNCVMDIDERFTLHEKRLIKLHKELFPDADTKEPWKTSV